MRRIACQSWRAVTAPIGAQWVIRHWFRWASPPAGDLGSTAGARRTGSSCQPTHDSQARHQHFTEHAWCMFCWVWI